MCGVERVERGNSRTPCLTLPQRARGKDEAWLIIWTRVKGGLRVEVEVEVGVEGVKRLEKWWSCGGQKLGRVPLSFLLPLKLIVLGGKEVGG
jgi:hypothetical protein